MKGFIVILSCIILAFVLLEKSGTFHVGSKTVMDGAIKVEKTSWEWHPEKLGPYLQESYHKWVGPFLQPTHAPSQKRKTQKPTHRLLLKNGTAVAGTIVQRGEKGVLFRSEEGEIFFHHEEILSIEEK